jgi:serine/threonine protein kinase
MIEQYYKYYCKHDIDKTNNSGIIDNKYYASISDFTLGCCIGNGSQGNIMLASTKDITVVIKKISNIGYFKNEITALTIVNDHPNIIKMYDFFTDINHGYIILEYIRGSDLFDYISLNHLEDTTISKYIYRQVLEGIAYCHSKGIVHRDIKLENVLMDRNMNIKIIDFGYAFNYFKKMYRTKTLGTLDYIAPEVLIANKQYGKEIDIWSAGVLLYELITNKSPFGNIDPIITRNNIKNIVYKIPTDSSEEFKNILKSIFVHDSINRLSIQELLNNNWLNQ